MLLIVSVRASTLNITVYTLSIIEIYGFCRAFPNILCCVRNKLCFVWTVWHLCNIHIYTIAYNETSIIHRFIRTNIFCALIKFNSDTICLQLRTGISVHFLFVHFTRVCSARIELHHFRGIVCSTHIGMKRTGSGSQFINDQNAGKLLTLTLSIFVYTSAVSRCTPSMYTVNSGTVFGITFSFVSSFAIRTSKKGKRNESRLKKFWRSPKPTSSDESTGAESPTHLKGSKLQQLQLSPAYNKPTCSLPLLQVWPSQVSSLSRTTAKPLCRLDA